MGLVLKGESFIGSFVSLRAGERLCLFFLCFVLGGFFGVHMVKDKRYLHQILR